ncbi:MAG: hypothetical protein ACRET1_10465 [Burkholderiales bacterium]
MIIAILSGCSMLAGVLPQAWSDPGDLIVQRQVSPRTAFRPGTGPVTSKINATNGITSGLGLNQYHGGTVAQELTNQQFANVVSGIPQGGVSGPAMGQAGGFTASSIVTTGSMVTGALSGNSVGGSGGGGGGMAGAVTGATGQIANALQGMGLMGR